MEEQAKKRPLWLWLLVPAAAIILVVVWYFAFYKTAPPTSVSEAHSTTTPMYAGQKVADIYSAAIPTNATVTQAISVVPASPDSSLLTKNRTYKISASASGFDPSSFTVNAFDTVTLDFTAVDGNYDLSIPYLGIYFYPVQKGQMKELILTPTDSGVFTFECRDYCPKSGTIKGTLTVIPQKF